MNGKIFNDSANIYQDQARILFNYYREAAEEITSKEEALEKQIYDTKKSITEVKTLIEKAKKAKVICFCLFFTIIGLILAFVNIQKEKKGNEDLIKARAKLKKLIQQHEDIFRDYRMDKMGVAYVPVANQVPFDGKSIIVDHTGTVGYEEFRIQVLKQGDMLKDKIEELNTLSQTAPVVEDSKEPEEIETDKYSRSIQKVVYNDYFGQLDRSLRTFSYCLKDLDESVVNLPVIHPNTAYSNFLDEFGTDEIGNSPVFDVYDMNEFDEDIDKFGSINDLRKSLTEHSTQIEEVLRKLMVNMADSVQTIASIKVASANKLIQHSNDILYQILKAPYNHYSPALEAEEIDRIKTESFNYNEVIEDYKPFNLKASSRVRYDLLSKSWVAEDGTKTNAPFGINQIQEEIIAPIVKNLLAETRLERLRIYNHIKDQKLDYLNKWHQDTEEFYGLNRTESSNLINIMRANLSEYITAYNTLSSLQKTADSMQSNGSLDASIVETEENAAETFAAYDAQSQEFRNIQNEFENYMLQLKDDIDRRAVEFEHIEYYDASLMDSNAHEIAVATEEAQDLEERRKPLVKVNPLFAKTSDLPPTPSVEDITYEHIGINLSALATNVLDEIDTEHEKLAAQNQAAEQEEEEDFEQEVDDDSYDQGVEEEADEQYEDEGEEEYEDEEDYEYEDQESDDEEDYYEEEDEEENNKR